MAKESPYVFISYSTSNLEIADHVKESLIQSGISCWMAPYSIPYGSSYPTEIFDAISNCKVFVLILSEQAMESVYVEKELDLAVSNRCLIIPFQIDDHTLSQGFRFFLCNVQILHAADSIEDGLAKMCDFIISATHHVAEPTTMLEAVPSQRFQGPDPSLIPREQLLKEIDALFAKGNLVNVCGMGGMGKSELAKLYTKRGLDTGTLDRVCYIEFAGSLKKTISSIPFDNFDEEAFLAKEAAKAPDKSVTDLLFERKLELLRRLDEKTVLVIDGFDKLGDEHQQSLSSLRCKVLSTSRCSFSNFQNLKVDPLATDDLRHLFGIYYEGFEDCDEDDLAAIDKIIELVRGHTLTIMLIALFLNVSGLSPEETLQEMTSTSRLNLCLDDEVEYEFSYGDVYQHVSSLFALSSLTDEERLVMGELSLLPMSGVPKRQFRSWTAPGTMTVVDQLVKKGWVQSNRGRIGLHPIINVVVDRERPHELEPMRDFLLAVADGLDVPAIDSISQRADAEAVALSIAEQIDEKSALACYLYLCFGRYLNDYCYWKFYGARNSYNYTFFNQAYDTGGEYDQELKCAFSYLEKALDIYEECGLGDQPLRSRIYSNLGSTCFNLGRYEEAARWHRLALEGRLEELPAAHEKVITSRRRLGTCCLTLDRPQEALECYEKNLEVIQHETPEDRFMVAKCWYDCGRANKACGDGRAALACFESAVADIDAIKDVDLFGCARLCYETAYLMQSLGTESGEKTLRLLDVGAQCTSQLDSELAESLARQIGELRAAIA